MTFERYGLTASPFTARSDAGFVPVPSRAKPLKRLSESLKDAQGISLLTAAPGLGKSTICRELARTLRTDWLVAILQDPGVSTRRSLLQAVLYELGMPYVGLTEQESRLRLLHTVRDRQPTFQGLMLLVDEAQRLNDRLLEELRSLINHEENGLPLVRVLLCGDLLLEERLLDPALSSINQRIVCHETLEPLSQEESARLIDGRIMQSGGDGWEHVFTRTAMELICLVSDGSPRNLEQLAHRSLVIAQSGREPRVSVSSVRLALEELRELPLQWNEPSNLEAYSARDKVECTEPGAGLADSDSTEEATMETGEQTAADDDVVAVVVGDEIPVSDRPGLAGMVSIEVGAVNAADPAADDSRPRELDALFTRSASESHALLDDQDVPSLEDTAVLSADDDLAANGTAEVEESIAFETPLNGHTAPTGPKSHDGSTEWQEFEVDDPYASLDSARPTRSVSPLHEQIPTLPKQNAGPPDLAAATPSPAPPAPNLPSAPAAEVISMDPIEDALLAEVQGISTLIGAATDRDPSVGRPELPAEWDVIQPEWISQTPFEPVEIDRSPHVEIDPADEAILRAVEADWTPSRAEKMFDSVPPRTEAAASRGPGASASPSPEPPLNKAPEANTGETLRIDAAAERPYAQLFSRLRRMRASAEGRLGVFSRRE